VPVSRIARIFVALCAFTLTLAALAPVSAGEPTSCDVAKARIFIAAGDRSDKHGRYVEATHWFLAANRYTRDCRAAGDLLIGSRAIAKAGSALAQSGEYLKALSLLHAAQARLARLTSGDSQIATAAQSFSDQVGNLIAAIDRVAESTM
jgi:hypothetical protein